MTSQARSNRNPIVFNAVHVLVVCLTPVWVGQSAPRIATQPSPAAFCSCTIIWRARNSACCAMRCGALDPSFPLSFHHNKRAPRATLLARLLLVLFPTAWARCLPNAILPEHRQNLTNTLGESYPIGLVLGAWRSAYLATAVIEILASSRACFQLLLPSKWLGLEEREASSSVPGMYATLGCATWYDAED